MSNTRSQSELNSRRQNRETEPPSANFVRIRRPRLSSRAFNPECIASARISSKEVGRPEAASRPFCRRSRDASPPGVLLKQTPSYNAVSLEQLLADAILIDVFLSAGELKARLSPFERSYQPFYSTSYKLSIFL